MRKQFALISLAFMVACSSVTNLSSDTPQGDPDAEEQAVYSVLLLDFQGQSVVLSETTEDGFEFRSDGDMPEGMPGLSRETWRDYQARNKPYPLSPDMDLGVEYTLLNAGEKSEIFNDFKDGWGEFYRRYPGVPGIIALSRLGFNRDMTEALVYMGTQSNYLAGTGNLIRLEKQNGAWKSMNEIVLWIS